MSNQDLYVKYLQRSMGEALDSREAVYISGGEVAEALWPLNELFRPHFHQIRALPYDPAFEAEADAAIEERLFSGASWESLNAGAWRVLLERQNQAIIIAMLNEREGNPLMPVPSGFPQEALTGAAMLFLLHSMELPYPPDDRSQDEAPEAAMPASLKLQ